MAGLLCCPARKFLAIAGGQEYRIMVNVARKTRGDAARSYAALYERAVVIANARSRNIQYCDGGVLHQRILNQGWFKHDQVNLARAFVCVGISCWKEEDSKPTGEATPTLDELAAPRIKAQTAAPVTLHEINNDADMRDAAKPTDIFLVSYEEYIKSAKGMDYGRFIQGGQNLAKFHLPFLMEGEVAQSHTDGLKIVRRRVVLCHESYVAVVHVYIQALVR